MCRGSLCEQLNKTVFSMAVALILIKLRRKQTNKKLCFFYKSYVRIFPKKITVFCPKHFIKWSKYGMSYTVELVIKCPID